MTKILLFITIIIIITIFIIFINTNYVEKFNKDDSISLWKNGIFYHYINFEEKYRPELMHEYIS